MNNRLRIASVIALGIAGALGAAVASAAHVPPAHPTVMPHLERAVSTADAAEREAALVAAADAATALLHTDVAAAATAFHSLGHALYLTGRLVKAADAFDRALVHASAVETRVDSHRMLAQIARRQSNPAAARQHYIALRSEVVGDGRELEYLLLYESAMFGLIELAQAQQNDIGELAFRTELEVRVGFAQFPRHRYANTYELAKLLQRDGQYRLALDLYQVAIDAALEDNRPLSDILWIDYERALSGGDTPSERLARAERIRETLLETPLYDDVPDTILAAHHRFHHLKAPDGRVTGMALAYATRVVELASSHWDD